MMNDGVWDVSLCFSDIGSWGDIVMELTLPLNLFTNYVFRFWNICRKVTIMRASKRVRISFLYTKG